MKAVKNKVKYILVNPSGEVIFRTLKEYKADCIEVMELFYGYKWAEAKKFGWSCKKVYVNITEEKL